MVHLPYHAPPNKHPRLRYTLNINHNCLSTNTAIVSSRWNVNWLNHLSFTLLIKLNKAQILHSPFQKLPGPPDCLWLGVLEPPLLPPPTRSTKSCLPFISYPSSLFRTASAAASVSNSMKANLCKTMPTHYTNTAQDNSFSVFHSFCSNRANTYELSHQ